MVALQKTKWKKIGNMDINNMKILFGQCNNREQLGVGFLVHKSILPKKKFKIKTDIPEN